MNLQEELRIINEQPFQAVMNQEISSIITAMKEHNPDLSEKWLMAEAYALGFIQGKRAERARRRKGSL